MEDKIKVKSLKKALDILECFSLEELELGITDISKRLDICKSNVHNIISTLEACGYIEQNKDNEKYRLGRKIIRLSHISARTIGFQSIVHKCVNELTGSIGEIVYFGIPDGENVMYMEGGFPEKAYNIRWIQGLTAPLVCTAIGKAMLAFLDEKLIETILQKPLTKFTDYTILDPEGIKEQLKNIRKFGYSIDNMEHEYGIKCVGVPVFDKNNDLIGALSTTGPSLRFDDKHIEIFANMLKEKAELIKRNT